MQISTGENSFFMKLYSCVQKWKTSTALIHWCWVQLQCSKLVGKLVSCSCQGWRLLPPGLELARVKCNRHATLLPPVSTLKLQDASRMTPKAVSLVPVLASDLQPHCSYHAVGCLSPIHPWGQHLQGLSPPPPLQCRIIRRTPAESVAGISIDLTRSCACMYLWTWMWFILVSAWPDWIENV